MFNNGASDPGIHLINLDNRYHRDPTFSDYGTCKGASSTMLGQDQWSWLENELNRTSEIKIIASGMQILPPTASRNPNEYCAYDGAGNTFDSANTDIGEGPGSGAEGTTYESWAEFPQERTRLLRLVQQSFNNGYGKLFIFISGDQHWAEIMEKKIPSRPGQDAVQVYEVTSSIKWHQSKMGSTYHLNTNRLRPQDYGFGARRELQNNISSQKGKETTHSRRDQGRTLRKKTPSPTRQPVTTKSPTKVPTDAPVPHQLKYLQAHQPPRQRLLLSKTSPILAGTHAPVV